jgi:paraquat-inducible protein B
MSDKPHAVAIGAFIVGALLIAFSVVIFFLGSGFGNREKIIMVFDGSVKGLNVGAPVALRGVQVGQVTDIEIILDADTLELIMLVEADFRSENIRRRGKSNADLTEELIQRGLRAQLNSQSLLTGLLYIQLDFHPDTKLVLADIDSPNVQFPTIPTDLARIAKKLQDLDFGKLANNLESAAQGINTLVNSAAFQSLPADAQATMHSLKALGDQLKSQLATSMPKVDAVLDGAAITVATANAELPKVAQQVRGDLAALNQAIASFEKTMTNINGLVSPDSATTYQLNQALRELALAGRSLQLLAKTLEEQPEALLRGRSGN